MTLLAILALAFAGLLALAGLLATLLAGLGKLLTTLATLAWLLALALPLAGLLTLLTLAGLRGLAWLLAGRLARLREIAWALLAAPIALARLLPWLITHIGRGRLRTGLLVGALTRLVALTALALLPWLTLLPVTGLRGFATELLGEGIELGLRKFQLLSVVAEDALGCALHASPEFVDTLAHILTRLLCLGEMAFAKKILRDIERFAAALAIAGLLEAIHHVARHAPTVGEILLGLLHGVGVVLADLTDAIVKLA